MPGKRNMRMDKPKIYLETTMFNFYYAPDAPGYRVLKGQVHLFFRIKPLYTLGGIVRR
jgi:hypothetical protein